MKKLVVLKFDGALKSGYKVNLTISNAGETPNLIISAKLPSALAVIKHSQSWCDTYRSFYGQSRIRPLGTKNVNIEALNQDFGQKSQELIISLNNWLASDCFIKVKDCLEELNIEDEIRVIITTSCQKLRKLPWHLWDVLQKYPYVEVALSAPNAERGERIYRDKARILVVLGDSTDINVEADRELLQEYCKNGEIVLLKEPSREILIHHLRDNAGWDMLFFSGHSRTEGSQGRIFLNKHDSLTMVELRGAMQIAINKRLQIAFFNSCDGLGIALELEQLNIPQVIVMREPVPDKVAQEFLKYFLHEFTGGQSLYLSIKKAREFLRNNYDVTFPCVSWLPVIIQNQLETPPTWQSLGIISLCPYRGLEIFREQDAEFFFGREAFVKDLLVNINRKPFVAVVGASGSGKSSVVFAGLIPKLHQGINTQWQIISFRPGNKPLESLAVAIKILKTIKAHSYGAAVFSISFSPDSKMLASASADETVKLWNIHTGNELQTFTGHKSTNSKNGNQAVFGVSFSPDGKTLASTSRDRTLKLWNLNTGKEIKTLKGHTNLVYGASFSPDGRTLVSVSGDNTIKLWDINTGSEIKTLKGHKGAVIGARFSTDGQTLFSVSKDNTVISWNLNLDDLLERGCSLVKCSFDETQH